MPRLLLTFWFSLAGYVAEILANWFIASGLPLPTIVKLLGEQDKIRKRKALEAMEVDNDERSVEEEENSNSSQSVAEEVEELSDLKYTDVNGRHRDITTFHPRCYGFFCVPCQAVLICN